MDPRLCKNNYFNATCTVKNCVKYHLRRSLNEETIIIDTHTNFFEHMASKNSKRVLATFPPGIKVHAFNITDCPTQWAAPPMTKHENDVVPKSMEVHHIVGLAPEYHQLLVESPDMLIDIQLSTQALITESIYTSISVELGQYNQETLETPGTILLSNVLNQYNKRTIPPATPLFIKAQEHSKSLHVLLDQPGLKNTPVIWCDHNQTKDNFLTSFANCVSNNHYFQINSSLSKHAYNEILPIIKNGMFHKLIPSSCGSDDWTGYEYHPHRIINTLCNIHQAVLESGSTQELFTTNERLIDNMLTIFPKMLKEKPSDGNPRLILNRATANLVKWFKYFNTKPLLVAKVTQHKKSKKHVKQQLPGLMDNLQKSPQPQRNPKRARHSDEVITSTPAKRSKPLKAITINWSNSAHASIMEQITNETDFSSWIIQQAEKYLTEKRQIEEFAAAEEPTIILEPTATE